MGVGWKGLGVRRATFQCKGRFLIPAGGIGGSNSFSAPGRAAPPPSDACTQAERSPQQETASLAPLLAVQAGKLGRWQDPFLWSCNADEALIPRMA